MANPTTNYGFVMPTSTDLVTDLPADFGVFGQAVDTQMLTNANAAIAKTIVDAKGDIIAATAADTVSRLAVGANDTVLTADSTAATGLKWAAAAAFSGCSLYKSTSQSVANDTTVTVTFDSEYFDTDGYHSTSTNNSRITIPAGKAGKFLLIAFTQWSANATGQRNLNLWKNGTRVTEYPFQTTAAGTAGSLFSVVVDAAVSDYFEVTCYQNSGSTRTISGTTTDGSYFQAIRLG